MVEKVEFVQRKLLITVEDKYFIKPLTVSNLIVL